MLVQRTVSIALATRNGARFLAGQLDSFLAQTRPPDELVVGDDGSDDATVPMIRQFAARAGFTVRITVNRPPLGPAANFAAAIARCSGDVVFLSDQDDIWHPNKLARMLAWFDANPRRMVALHDAALVDGDGHPLGRTMGQQLIAAGVSPDTGLVAGCCMAIDGRLARLFSPAPVTRTHDAWLTSIADLLDVRGYLPEPLIDYRRHGANVSQSYMSDARPASPLRRLRERAARAAGEPAAASLERAIADRASAIRALETHRGVFDGVVPDGRVDAALRTLHAAQARDGTRLGVHRTRRLARPLRVFQALAGDTYCGKGGWLSLARDVFDAARRG
ncbi:MAG: glycosyltransferase [Pseudomonadota bacterium]